MVGVCACWNSNSALLGTGTSVVVSYTRVRFKLKCCEKLFWLRNWQSHGIWGKWNPPNCERVGNPGLRKDHSPNLLRKNTLKHRTNVDTVPQLCPSFTTLSPLSRLLFYLLSNYLFTGSAFHILSFPNTPPRTHTHFSYNSLPPLPTPLAKDRSCTCYFTNWGLHQVSLVGFLYFIYEFLIFSLHSLGWTVNSVLLLAFQTPKLSHSFTLIKDSHVSHWSRQCAGNGESITHYHEIPGPSVSVFFKCHVGLPGVQSSSVLHGARLNMQY